MYRIDGINLSEFCGFVADSSRDTSNSFEKPADPVEVFSHRWPDGVVEYDTVTVPGKMARVFLISGYIQATNEADYNFKKANLEELIRKPIITIHAEEIDETVNAKLKKFARWERLTPVKHSDKIVLRIALEFDELLGIPFPSFGVFLGSTNQKPVTSGQIQTLNAVPFTTPIELQTGIAHRIHTIAIQSDKQLISATDLSAGQFGNLNYSFKGNVVVNGVTYKVYSLELGLPYSINHTHQFIIA